MTNQTTRETVKLIMLGDLLGSLTYKGRCPICGVQHMSDRDLVTAKRVCRRCATNK